MVAYLSQRENDWGKRNECVRWFVGTFRASPFLYTEMYSRFNRLKTCHVVCQLVSVIFFNMVLPSLIWTNFILFYRPSHQITMWYRICLWHSRHQLPQQCVLKNPASCLSHPPPINHHFKHTTAIINSLCPSLPPPSHPPQSHLWAQSPPHQSSLLVSPPSFVSAHASDTKATPSTQPNTNLAPIKGFTHKVLHRSHTSSSVLQTALCYMEAVHAQVPELIKMDNKSTVSQISADKSSKRPRGRRVVRTRIGSVRADSIHLDAAINSEATTKSDSMAVVKVVDGRIEPDIEKLTWLISTKHCKREVTYLK